MRHSLKIWPAYFERVKDGSKTFEYRNNDRGFQCGDTVTLHEWDPKISNGNTSYGYTGKSLEFLIGFVLPVECNFVIFSLLKIGGKNEENEIKTDPVASAVDMDYKLRNDE